MAKTEVKRTGYTVDTPKNYLVDAGAIYKNIEWDSAGKKWKGELLGATSDGNKVSIVTTYRTIEVDGVFTPAKGQKIIDKAEATLEVNVKEITAENIRLALNGKKETGSLRTLDSKSDGVYLTVNARVEVHPDTLVEIIKEEVERVFSAVGYKQEKLNALIPGRPNPTFRYREIVKL